MREAVAEGSHNEVGSLHRELCEEVQQGVWRNQAFLRSHSDLQSSKSPHDCSSWRERERAANGRVSDKHRGNVRQGQEHTSQQNRNCDTSCAQAGVQRTVRQKMARRCVYHLHNKEEDHIRAREAKPNSSTKRGAHLQPRPKDLFNRRLKPESQETRESVHSTLPLQRKWHVWKRLARLDVPSTEESRHENYQNYED